MKLLFITPTAIDFDSGGAIRSSYMRSSMMEVGAVQTLVIDIGPTENDHGSCKDGGVRQVTFVKGGLIHAFGDFLRRRRYVGRIIENEDYDAVVVRYVSMALLLPLKYWRVLVIDADDLIKRIHAGDGASLRRRIAIRIRNALVVRIVPLAGHVWFVNPLDKRLLRTKRATYLGNVICPPRKAHPRSEAISGRVLMVGLLKYKPNSDGLLWFAREILPALTEIMPGIELHAVGRHSPGLEIDNPRVHLRGFVADLSTEYDRASLVIAPIQSGGGTQMKVIEALAYGRPLVASRFAHSGFAGVFNENEHLLVASNREEWISHCKRLLTDAVFAEAIGANGSRATGCFDPSTMASIVKTTLDGIATRKDARAGTSATG